MNNGVVAIYMVLYFWFINKNWEGIEFFAAIITIISIAGIIVLPESPKFLLSQSRWGEARGAITYIAKFNQKGEVFTGKFDRERFSMFR